MKFTKIISLLIICIYHTNTVAQSQAEIDSTIKVIENTSVDSTKARLMNEFAWKVRYKDSELAKTYTTKGLELSRKIDFKAEEARSLAILGSLKKNQGLMDEALEFYDQSLKVRKELGDKKMLAEINNHIGIVYAMQANYPKTLEYWKKGVEIYGQTDEVLGLASILGNIGVVYDNLGDYNKALEYYLQALKMHESLPNNKGAVAAGLNNIGLIYSHIKNYDLALNFQRRALQLRKETQELKGLGDSYLNLAEIHKLTGNFDSCKYYINLSMDAYKQIGNKTGIASTLLQYNDVYTYTGEYEKTFPVLEECLQLYTEIGDSYGVAMTTTAYGISEMHRGNYQKADELLKEAKKIFTEIEFKSNVGNVYMNLAENEYLRGNGKRAYEYIKKYALLNDSLINDESTKQIAQMQTIYESEKNQLEIENLNQKNTLNEVRIDQEKQQKYLLFLGLALVIIVAGFVFNRLQITRKQKMVIEEQKEEVESQRDQIEIQKNVIEEKHQEITESITYAKRIQTAILPPFESILKYLPHSFIIYQPKEVVAGDFYWMEKVGDDMYLAAADCTGHGVPGAMVSVVCHGALNRSIREYNLTKPSEILDKTRELVISTFEKSKEQVKDGMDISLIKLNISTKTAEWAGANNPLYILRNKEIEIIKADRQPIGYMENSTPFTNHTFTLNRRDHIYLFTDGYADQFGGDDDKKLGYKEYRDQLSITSELTIDKQKDQLVAYFNQWKGSSEQIDDVCILGIRI